MVFPTKSLPPRRADVPCARDSGVPFESLTSGWRLLSRLKMSIKCWTWPSVRSGWNEKNSSTMHWYHMPLQNELLSPPIRRSTLGLLQYGWSPPSRSCSEYPYGALMLWTKKRTLQRFVRFFPNFKDTATYGKPSTLRTCWTITWTR